MGKDDNGDFPGSPATLLSHEEVRPQVVGQRRKSMSRVAAYRRKLRRQRNRRISAIIAIVIACMAAGLTYKANHPELKLQTFVPVKTLDVGPLDNYLDRVANRIQKSLSKKPQTSSGALEEPTAVETIIHAETLKQEPYSEPEPAMEIENELEMGEDAETEENESERYNEEDDDENAKQREESPPHLVQQLQVDKPSTEQEIIEDHAQESRPALCNIPLAYLVHKKCRKLASRNPVFNLNSLVQDMIE